jgi:hypothetical protein
LRYWFSRGFAGLLESVLPGIDGERMEIIDPRRMRMFEINGLQLVPGFCSGSVLRRMSNSSQKDHPRPSG